MAGRSGQGGMGGRGERAGQQAEKRPVPRGPLPEHAQQERGEQRGVDEAEHQLDEIHDVVEPRGGVGGGDAHHDAEDRGHAAHPEIVPVAAVRSDVALIDVVGPDGVEGRDVARHARHERSHQRRQPQAQQAGGKILHEHHGDDQVVVQLDVSLGSVLYAIDGLPPAGDFFT